MLAVLARGVEGPDEVVVLARFTLVMHKLGTCGLSNQSASIPAGAHANLVPCQIGIGVGAPTEQQIGRATQHHKVLHIIGRLQLAQDGLTQRGR